MLTLLVMLYISGALGMLGTGLIGYIHNKRADEDTFGFKVGMMMSPLWPMVLCHVIIETVTDILINRELDREELSQ